MANGIVYREGFKYQLVEPYSVRLPLYPASYIDTHFIKISTSGDLVIAPDYAWDGPSGPTIDSLSSMRGSLIHDALYQMIRAGALTPAQRKTADDIYRNACIQDGMFEWRANGHFKALEWFGMPAARPSGERPLLRAP